MSFEEVFRSASVGVVELFKRSERTGEPIKEIVNEPREMRLARGMLSSFAAVRVASAKDNDAGRHVDLTASLHETLAMFTLPACEWPGYYRETESDFAYYPLINGELLTPERIAYDQAAVAGEMSDIEENAHYSRLMGAIEELSADVGSALYSRARQYIVQGPVRRASEVRSFIFTSGEIGPVIEKAYKSVEPQFVAMDGKVRRCTCCGNVMLPVQQSGVERFVCVYRDCRSHENGVVPEIVGDPSEVKVVDKSLLTFWVFPGLDEMELYQALNKSKTRAWSLYPNFDEVDIGDGNREVGIDVKSYARPGHLGASFAVITAKEGLLRYRRQIVAVPDRLVKGHPDYLVKAEREMVARRAQVFAGWKPEFMSFSQVLKEFDA